MLLAHGLGNNSLVTWGYAPQTGEELAITELTPTITRALELRPLVRTEDVGRVPWPATVDLRPRLQAEARDDGLGEPDAATYGLASLGEGYELPLPMVAVTAAQRPSLDASAARPRLDASALRPRLDASIEDDGLGDADPATYGLATLGEGPSAPVPRVVVSVEPRPQTEAEPDDKEPEVRTVDLRPKLR